MARAPVGGYFPAYESITGSFNGNGYFQGDCRGICERGVEHAMRCFLANYAVQGIGLPKAPPAGISPDVWADVACDEEAMASIRR